MGLLPPQSSCCNCLAVRATLQQGILCLLSLLLNLLVEEVVLLLHREQVLSQLDYGLPRRILRGRRSFPSKPCCPRRHDCSLSLAWTEVA